MFLHHEIRKSSVGVVNRKNLSGFCIRGGDLSGFCTPYISHCQISFFTVIEEEGMTIFPENLSGFCIRGGGPVGILHPPQKTPVGILHPLVGILHTKLSLFRKWKPQPPSVNNLRFAQIIDRGSPLLLSIRKSQKTGKNGFSEKKRGFVKKLGF